MARISEERLNHLKDRSKELTKARARIEELEKFVMAEGDIHYSHREFEKMEAKLEQAEGACRLLLSGLGPDGYLTNCGAVRTQEAIDLMAEAGLADPRVIVSGNQL